MGNKKTFIITLIILILIAVAGVITYITYDAYVKRSKAKEAFSLIEPAQHEIERYVIEHNGIPMDEELSNKSFSLPQPFDMNGTYINNIVVHKAINTEEIIVYARINSQLLPGLEGERGNHVEQPYIRYIGIYENKQLNWHCLSNLAKRFLPDKCVTVIE